MSVLLVGNPQPTHVGGHWLNAARHLGVPARLMDVNEAFAAPRFLQMMWWHLLGHSPARLAHFSRQLIQRCAEEKPAIVLTTGLAPVHATALAQLRNMGIILANFLTDDPWNRFHRAPWFMKGLPLYHHIFTPRHANIPELEALKKPAVHYLPFAYAPEIHFPPPPMSNEESAQWHSSLLFIGGADAERKTFMADLSRRGLPLSLWGGYWARDPQFRQQAHPHACPDEFRRLVACADVNLCLVRRANRDGHSMRSFELPAIGGCMLVEDTPDHRSLFGLEGECVRYFSSTADLQRQAHALFAAPTERVRLAKNVLLRIRDQGQHTYADRFQEILTTCNA